MCIGSGHVSKLGQVPSPGKHSNVYGAPSVRANCWGCTVLEQETYKLTACSDGRSITCCDQDQDSARTIAADYPL